MYNQICDLVKSESPFSEFVVELSEWGFTVTGTYSDFIEMKRLFATAGYDMETRHGESCETVVLTYGEGVHGTLNRCIGIEKSVAFIHVK